MDYFRNINYYEQRSSKFKFFIFLNIMTYYYYVHDY
jgi:hypothetical protein